MAMPEKKFKCGAVSASVFVNEVRTGSGMAKVKTVTLQRTYKDRNGQWQNTNSYRLNDVPKAKLVLDKAYEYVAAGEEAE